MWLVRGLSVVEFAVLQQKGIFPSIQKVTNFVSEISVSSKDQASAAEEIASGLSQVNSVVQQNTSVFEETASATQELRNQSDLLHDLVARFRLND